LIALPPKLNPSELLYLDDVSRLVTKLLRDSRSLRLEGRWTEAEQSARGALDSSQAAGTQVSRGAALIHLADVHLAMARIGAALQEARRAYRLFGAQPSRYQRHNEAIAAYALGLAHQSLGGRIEALGWYEESIELLERVQMDWSAKNALSRVRSCRRTQHWIEALMECLTDAESPASIGSHTSLWLPFFLSETESRFSLVRFDVEKYVVASTVELAGKTFHVELVDGPGQASLPSVADCYALRIPRRALPLLDAEDGDYAVIVRQNEADHEGPGVLETLSGVEFGDFRRDQSGRISFVRRDATVIGGENLGDDLPVGYVTALLRRERH
jgi:hypothetical protein